MTTKTISGEVKEIPYGNWSDVDTGWYIGSDNIRTLLYEYEGKNVKISIEVLPDAVDESEIVWFRLSQIIKNNDAIKYFGLNPWCVNEGADPNEKYSCTINQAIELRLI